MKRISSLAVTVMFVIVLTGCGSNTSDYEDSFEQYGTEQETKNYVPDSFDEDSFLDCDPNYEGECVPNVGYDLDCPDITGPVYVVGSDVHRFDRDGDGIGCEPY